MSDPRCNCGEADCPICNAPAHQPWQPKAGAPAPPLPQITLEQLEERLDGQRQWERRETIRRTILVSLMCGLGGMIGGLISALTLLHYLD